MERWSIEINTRLKLKSTELVGKVGNFMVLDLFWNAPPASVSPASHRFGWGVERRERGAWAVGECTQSVAFLKHVGRKENIGGTSSNQVVRTLTLAVVLPPTPRLYRGQTEGGGSHDGPSVTDSSPRRPNKIRVEPKGGLKHTIPPTQIIEHFAHASRSTGARGAGVGGKEATGTGGSFSRLGGGGPRVPSKIGVKI